MSKSKIQVYDEALQEFLELKWDGGLLLSPSELDEAERLGPRRYLEMLGRNHQEDLDDPLTDFETHQLESNALRISVMQSNLDRFLAICTSAGHLVRSLIELKFDTILAERASLRSLTEYRRPSPHVRYEIPTPSKEAHELPPHVLGSRLLWWCAAMTNPKEFGLDNGDYPRLWALPIWADVRPTEEGLPEVWANPRPLQLMKDAAQFVDEVRESSNVDFGERARSLRDWSIGLNEKRQWQLFRKVGGKFQHQGSLQVSAGLQHNLLEMLLQKPGGIDLDDLIIKSKGGTIARQQIDMRLRKSTRTNISHFRTKLREKLRLSQNADLFDISGKFISSHLNMGVAVEDENGIVTFEPATPAR